MGEEQPVKPDGTCDELDFFSTDGKFCGFGGRIDIVKNFLTTGGFWGAKETVPKLLRFVLNSFPCGYPTYKV